MINDILINEIFANFPNEHFDIQFGVPPNEKCFVVYFNNVNLLPLCKCNDEPEIEYVDGKWSVYCYGCSYDGEWKQYDTLREAVEMWKQECAND